MLNDNSNYLYLKIMKPILFELNEVKISFQSENVDTGCAHENLANLVQLLAKKNFET